MNTNGSHRILFSFLVKTGNFLLILSMVLAPLWTSVNPVHAAPAGTALQFNGTNQYVTFGAATAELGVTSFTLETWFYWLGGGSTTNTGTGGIYAIPLITKGRGEAENSNVDMNYFLGITSGGHLAADFEANPGGQNYPVTGILTVTPNAWHHAAVTYNGQVWNLYLDGVLDTTLDLTTPRVPRSDSIQHAGLATAMNSTGVREGYFQGMLDEARIWNRALDSTEIQANMYAELLSGTGLIARWGLNDGSGTTAANSVAGSVDGALMNGPAWVTGFPDNVPPAAPTDLVAVGAEGVVNLSWTAPADTDIDGYNVYRSETSGFTPGAALNSTLVTGTTYPDLSGIAGTPYYYVVRAVDTSGNESGSSGEATGTPLADSTAPSAPTGLSATAGNTTVALSWTANSEVDVVGYNVYHSTASPVELSSPINGGTLVSGTTYYDSGLTNGQLYYYVITAVDGSDNESDASDEASATPEEVSTGLQFDGTNDYVTFGAAPGLGVTDFTLETWFYWTGGGVTTTTSGTQGLPSVYPLISKGRGEADGSNVDMNYFLGIDASTHALACDFEDTATGMNYPYVGTTPVTTNTWHHAAVTYDSASAIYILYLDGDVAGTSDLGSDIIPRYDSIQHAGIASAMTSTGTPAGYFQGMMDEVRIWNVVRNQAEILSTINEEITSGTGLVARWGLNEGSGSAITSSVGDFPGVLTNGPIWVTPGAPFNIAPPTVPTAPSDLSVTATNSTVLALSWTDNSTNETGFEIERSSDGVGGPFSLVDTASANAVSYPDSGLAPETEYCYQIRAVNAVGESDYTDIACGTTLLVGASALQFDGTNDYVTFGAAPGLGVSTFTMETWFYWTGGGTTANTGSGGITAIPLITKGLHETDGSNVDANYFLGITTAGKLVSDFEADPGGQNYPVTGSLTVTTNAWHHAAVTYDGQVWKLYLDGNLDTTLDLGTPRAPRDDSIQHAGLGTAMNSSGTTEGFFQGTMDEVRIWNVARTMEQIRGDINNELTSGTGLVARWGLDEGSGITITSSIGDFPGTLTNGPVWVAPGAPFDIVFETNPPAAPTGLTALGANASVTLDWDDNTEPDLAGYNVYRGTTPGTYSKINSTLATSSTYADTGLTNGVEYFYVVTAVDTSMNESGYSNVAYAIPMVDLGSGLAFTTSSGTYVTFGDPAKLDLPTFTIETWFKRTGAGTPSTTGTNGLTNAIPLVTHGAPEQEGSSVDANWELLIDNDSGAIAADFEDMVDGTNHPVYGVTPVSYNVWHHVAATYDGTTWRLYLDGNLETTLVDGAAPRSDTTQLAALGTMLTTTGGTNGFFQGVLDEARVWDHALTQTELISHINQQITSGDGLVARWGMNEGSGTTVGDSIDVPVNGTITGANYAWVPGAPFDLALAPDVPTLVVPADGASDVSIPATLTVNVDDPLNSGLTVSFYGRQGDGPGGEDFSLIAIPDPQYYASAYPSIYSAQMDWVVANKTNLNIPYVISLGDNVDDINSSTQWTNATTSWDILTTGGVPYGIEVGNHDGGPSNTTNFNIYFGSRIAAQPTYGGRYGTSDYDNTYATFSAGGMDFIMLFIEYDDGMTSVDDPVLVWANDILQANLDKRAIVITHNLLNGNNFTSQGAAIYNALKVNPNLFLMLGGHLDTTGQRMDLYEGRTVYSLRSDYQFVDSQQSGYLRIMRFSPADDLIYVSTYSPTQDKYLTDSANQFELDYPMDGAADFELIGTDTVSAGEDASVTWSGLLGNTHYEWYAVSDNGADVALSPIWSFTTLSAGNNPPQITESNPQTLTMSEDSDPNPFNLTLHATDADAGDTLTWSISTPAAKGTATATGTGASKDIGYVPNANENGSDSFDVQVSDGHGGTDTITVDVTIQAVNDAPDVTNPGLQNSVEGDVIDLGIVAIDVDSVVLTYSAGDLPDGLSIDPDTGVISGTISYTAADLSPYSSSVSVTDGTTPTMVNFTWTVAETTITYTISGNVGVQGATISFTGGTPVTSDAGGDYSITVPYDWSGTVTPALTGYTFSPPSRTYSNVLANVAGEDYDATPIPYLLTVSKTGDGSGSVTSLPAGIDCGSTCSNTFDFGTEVSLTAAPLSNYDNFVGWSGGGCSGAGECTLTINGAITVTAEFEAATFGDVPFDYELHDYVEALWNAGYTSGCSADPLLYCPDSIMDRAESAVFMLRGQFGTLYTPDTPTGILNDDWISGPWAEIWAEAMVNEGLSAGCWEDPLQYCPWTQLTRQEASVFGLRMKYGMSYVPPEATGTLFADMTDPQFWSTAWAEQAYLDGLLPACSVEGDPLRFCPEDLVDRGWGAYLIVTAKELMP